MVESYRPPHKQKKKQKKKTLTRKRKHAPSLNHQKNRRGGRRTRVPLKKRCPLDQSGKRLTAFEEGGEGSLDVVGEKEGT